MYLTRYTVAGYGIIDEYGRLLHGFKDKQSALNANIPEDKLVLLYRLLTEKKEEDDEVQIDAQE